MAFWAPTPEEMARNEQAIDSLLQPAARENLRRAGKEELVIACMLALLGGPTNPLRDILLGVEPAKDYTQTSMGRHHLKCVCALCQDVKSGRKPPYEPTIEGRVPKF